MAITVAELSAKLVADISDYSSKMGEAQKTADGFTSKLSSVGSSMEDFGKGMMTKVSLPIVGVFTEGFKALSDQQTALAQTNAVITSTGGAAHVTAGHVSDLADHMAMLSGASKEQVQAGENMLLTFTNIRNGVGKGNDVFDQATLTVQNMATALGEDSTNAAMQLGKALNDPVKGVTALRRVGVQFTDDQQKQIDAMVKSGNVMGAQKIILHELGTEFGGSAAAAGTTFAGSLGRMHQSIKDATASLAQALLPAIQKLSGFLAQAIAWFQGLSPHIKNLIAYGLAAAAALGPLIFAIGALGPGIAALLSPVGLIVVGFAAVAAGVIYAYTHFVAFRDFVGNLVTGIENLWSTLKDLADTFLTAFKWGGDMGGQWSTLQRIAFDLGKALGTAADFVVSHWGDVKTAFAAVVSFVTGTVWPALRKVISDVGSLFGPLVGMVTSAFGAVKAVITQAVVVIQDLWARFGGQLLANARTAWNAIVNVVQQTWTAIMAVIRGAIGVVTGLFDLIKAILTGKWGEAWSAILKILAGAWQAILGAIKGAWDLVVGAVKLGLDGISTLIGGAMAAISALWGLIWHSIATLATDIWTQITGAITAAWNGIVSFFTDVAPGAIGAAWSAIWGGIKDAVSGLWGAISGAVTGAWNGLVGFFTNTAPNAIASAWSTIWNGLKNAVGGLWSGITAAVTGAWTGIVNFFTGAPGAIARATVGLFDGIKDAFKTAINTIIGWWNSLHFSLPKMHIPGTPFDVGGFDFGVPHIPTLDTGGIALGPTLAALAMNRKPEVVLPLDRLKDLVPYTPPPTPVLPAGGGGHVTNVYITVQATDLIGDSRRVIDRIHEGLKAKNRVNGSLHLGN